VSEPPLHPSPERLEALVEGDLPEAERSAIEAHVAACVRCQAEVEEWRTVFAVLASLPRLAPSPGFADRVLARVRIERPWTARIAALLARLAPRTTAGWALLTACLTLPAAAATALIAWILTRPGLNAETLMTVMAFLRERAADLLLSFAGHAATTAMESTLAAWIARLIERILAAAPAQLGAAAAVFTALTLASVWVLYRHLFRPSNRKVHHASFLF
jgi:anti-sigma factor RsiW